MGLEDILKRMEEDAEKKIRELDEDYKRKREELERTFGEELKQIEDANRAEFEAHKKRIKEELLSRARSELKMKLLAEKEKILDSVFESAFNRIAQLDEHEYAEFYSNKLGQLNLSSGEFVVGKADKDRLSKILDGYIRSGKFGLRVSEDFSYGFILDAGKIRYDFRLDSIINEIRFAVEDKVAKILFG